MSYFEVVSNDIPNLIEKLPGVIQARTETAARDGRGATKKAIDEDGQPSSDTGAAREGQAIQTETNDDYEQTKEAAKTAFVGNPSRWDPKGRMHTAERFEELCGQLEPLPKPTNRFEIIVGLTAFMIYGYWWENGDAWDLTKKEKRPASPWFEPGLLAWAAGEYTSHFDGTIEEALR